METTEKSAKNWEQHWYEECNKTSMIASGVIGYMGAVAKYGEDLPTKTRVNMLNFIIETLRKEAPQDKQYQRWADEYEEAKKKILAS